MEFLSKQFNESHGSNINLVIQSLESQAAGYNAVFTPGFALPHLPFRPDQDFHEYRFDWTPSQVAFYADRQLLHVMTEDIPTSGGHMVFNHWSNGDPGWSAGPPTEDTYITISHAHFYFNSSDSTIARQFSKACSTFDSSQVCTIKDDISIALMPSTGGQGSSPSLPTPTGSKSTSTPVWIVPNHASTDTDKHRDSTVYVIVAVVVGLVIVSFIGCMVTFRYWIALKNKLCGKMGLKFVKNKAELREMKNGLVKSDATTPDTELESQKTPIKIARVSPS
jgi:beta-glucanase (GH16 family)